MGDNGQPLAVIEAKKSGNVSLQAGREQARMYADGFERMGMQRPVIFTAMATKPLSGTTSSTTPTVPSTASTARTASNT